MKKIIIILFALIIIPVSLSAQEYDSSLAKSLNADEYGMKKYVLVILKTGSVNVTDKAELDSLFAGHMNTIKRLGESGKLSIAGPLEKNENKYRGIFIFNVETTDEAKLLVAEDPTVNAGVFDVEMYSLYGSAVFSMIPELHKIIQKKSF